MSKKELLAKLESDGFSKKILKAFKDVNREDFVPEEYQDVAYEDTALPIGNAQTISQPYTIAFMLTLLELRDKQKILEIGSGSGYVLCLISKISKGSKIYGIEMQEEFVEKSKNVLKSDKNIKIILGDGSKGLKKFFPYDRVLVSASARELPKNLIKQLKIDGIMVVPVKNSIFKVKKLKNGDKIEEYPGFVFVPLI